MIGIIDRQCDAVEDQPFAWRTSDCATFAQGVVSAAGGPHFLSEFPRDRYEIAASDQKIGVSELFRALTGMMRRAGCRKVSRLDAQPGDLAFVEVNTRHAVAVMYVGGWAIARAPFGWMAVPPEAIKRVWAWR